MRNFSPGYTPSTPWREKPVKKRTEPTHAEKKRDQKVRNTLMLHKSIGTKEDIRRMERTLSVNYPVLRQNKRVLYYTFVKNHWL